jgi:hypothetical protein
VSDPPGLTHLSAAILPAESSPDHRHIRLRVLFFATDKREDAIALLKLKPKHFISDPSRTPRFGPQDRDLWLPGYKHVVVEVFPFSMQRRRNSGNSLKMTDDAAEPRASHRSGE